MYKYALLLVFAAVVVSLVGATRRQVTNSIWTDCGTDPNRPFHVRAFNVTPYPIEIPGSVTISLTAETTREVENMDLKLSIRRHLFRRYYLPIPCIRGQGSCTHRDVCGLLHPADPADEYEPVTKIKKMFRTAGSPLTCPFQRGRVNIVNYREVLPEVPSFVSFAVAGTYELEAKFQEPGTHLELGCFRMKVEVKEKEPEPDEDDCWFWCS